MDKISTPLQKYKLEIDIREEPIKTGKMVYLFLLFTLIACVFHFIFSDFYLLKGDGFVYSKYEDISVPFDIRVDAIFVKDGDFVKKGSALFDFTSLELREKLVTLAIEISKLKQAINEKRMMQEETQKRIDSAQEYAALSTQYKQRLNTIESAGVLAKNEFTSELKRAIDAEQTLLHYTTQEKILSQTIEDSNSDFVRLESYFNKLQALEQDGHFLAQHDGIVTGLNVADGSGLVKHSTIAKLFHGDRFILCYFNNHSIVSYQVGDPVILDIPGKGYHLGWVTELLPVSDRVPEEFQPRFKPAQRYPLAVIKTAPGLLESTAMLSTVEVKKPLGLGLFIGKNKAPYLSQ